MFQGKITFDTLILRYPPSVAEYLMEEIARADRMAAAAMNTIPANQDVVHDMMRADDTASVYKTSLS